MGGHHHYKKSDPEKTFTAGSYKRPQIFYEAFLLIFI